MENNKKLLANAIDYIMEIEGEDDRICTRLHDIPEEQEICFKECESTLKKECIVRFLKAYKADEESK